VFDVFVSALLDVSGLHRQQPLGSVQRLHCSFVHTEHDRLLRRRQVKPGDVDDLGSSRSGRGELQRLGLPRPEALVLPDRVLGCNSADQAYGSNNQIGRCAKWGGL
jgi:hypothetical protein